MTKNRCAPITPTLLVDWYVAMRCHAETNAPLFVALTGAVFDHPHYPDGRIVFTSTPLELRGNLVRTAFSVYRLGTLNTWFRHYKLASTSDPLIGITSVEQLVARAVDGDEEYECHQLLRRRWQDRQDEALSPRGPKDQRPHEERLLPPLREIPLVERRSEAETLKRHFARMERLRRRDQARQRRSDTARGDSCAESPKT